MRAVLGLGNPGARYRHTRHNMGLLLLDRLAERDSLAFRDTGDRLLECSWAPPPDGPTILLAKSSTFMNHSGRAADRLRRRHGLVPGEILVVLDDLDLPFGRLRLRPRGGAGTHNGMRSVLEALGGEEPPRLRLGIGPAPEDADLAAWVLDEFGASERDALPEHLDRAIECVTAAVRDGIGPAMNRHNAGPQG